MKGRGKYSVSAAWLGQPRFLHPLSANSFSHALMPFGFAFRRYDAFSVAVQRKCTCSVPRSLAGKGGLPRFLGLSMPALLPTQIILDKRVRQVFNVYTLNQEATMETKFTDLKKAMAWYNAASKAGFAATLQTLVPCKEWLVVVVK